MKENESVGQQHLDPMNRNKFCGKRQLFANRPEVPTLRVGVGMGHYGARALARYCSRFCSRDVRVSQLPSESLLCLVWNPVYARAKILFFFSDVW